MRLKLLSLAILASLSLTLQAQKPKVTKVTTLGDPIQAGSGGMEVDAAGNIYVSNFGLQLGRAGGAEIFKMTPEGEISLFAEGINGASGSDIGPDGLFYQSNVSGRKISVVQKDGSVSDFATEGFFSPVGLVKTKDALFVANCGSGTIQKVDKDGNSKVFAKSDLLKCPNGLEMDDQGNLYTANFSSSNIVKIDPEGNASVLASLPGSNNGHLVFRNGLFYVVARGVHQIYTIDLAGNVELLAGSGKKGNLDGSASEATFTFPNDLAFSPDGSKLYVNDVGAETQDGRLLGPVLIRVLHLTYN
ncbi:hypothetical protein BFP97_06195 [Roseivirga sp. 4D4]|uniref:SMP-30/gluconolactonase/LRE family protein n=1 Tax=Roseivirga sp. 4D4 TaxID=1889784 RepID=UPI0008534FD5|nr:SMP-30/gluconolactonase/LRE family protein [Roseivirga sp. 4D4]OEK01122.1 hypothetical protein BFP97_06195 [Roseivirga sp. 4D4]